MKAHVAEHISKNIFALKAAKPTAGFPV